MTEIKSASPSTSFAWNLRPTGTGQRVLVVDDQLANREMMVEWLRRLGWAADVANDGGQALELLQQAGADCPWRLVLMDLQMPEMDGYEATQRIRQNPQWNQLPILAVSALPLISERARCEEVGFDGYLNKPMEPKVWREILSHWLPNSSEPVQKAPKVSEPPLPSGSGLDTGSGLRRCSDNPRLYYSLLNDLASRIPRLEAGFQAALEQNEFSRLKFLAHALRGESSNLGLPGLSDKAAALEESSTEACKLHWPELRQELRQTQSLLLSLLKDQEILSQAPPGDLRQLLKDLRCQLQHCEGQALETFERLQASSPQLPLQLLGELVNQFEFESALLELDSLEQHLQNTK